MVLISAGSRGLLYSPFKHSAFLNVKLLAIIPFLLLQFNSIGQNAEIKFGVVPSSDILLKSAPGEPDADALVLAKKTYLYKPTIANSILRKDFERIKIFRSSAFDLADIVIEYYDLHGLEEIVGLDAMITYPDGSNYHLTEADVRKEKIGKEWTQIKLKFPNLKEGCIIEYEYELLKNYLDNPQDFIFQYDIPVRYAQLTYLFHKDLDCLFIQQGKQYIETGSKIFTMSNVPSLKAEPYITSFEEYRGKIKIRIKTHRNSYGDLEIVTPPLGLMLSDLTENRMFGFQYTNKAASKKIISDANHILNAEISIEEKIDSLQNFLLSRVTWNGKSELFSEKGISKAYKKQEANNTELNLMFISLLRAMDINAYPVLVSERSNGSIYKDYPSIYDFSYAIIYAVIEGINILMDISDPYKSPTILNYNVIDMGLVVKGGDPLWVEIKPRKVSDVYLAEFRLENNILVGKLRTKHNLHSAYLERDYTREEDFLDHWRLRLQKHFPRAYVHSGKHENLTAIHDFFKQEFEIEAPSAVILKADTMEINPFLYSAYDENPFTAKERNFDINFTYPFSEQYIFQLDIPENYSILKLPESISITNEDKMAVFQLGASQINDHIQIVKRLEIKKHIFDKEEYIDIKNIFQAMQTSLADRIVLVKNPD